MIFSISRFQLAVHVNASGSGLGFPLYQTKKQCSACDMIWKSQIDRGREEVPRFKTRVANIKMGLALSLQGISLLCQTM